jgi:hypothetical protein
VSRTGSLGNAFYEHRLHYQPQKPSSARVDLALQHPQTSRRAFLGQQVPLALNGVLTVRTKHDLRPKRLEVPFDSRRRLGSEIKST